MASLSPRSQHGRKGKRREDVTEQSLKRINLTQLAKMKPKQRAKTMMNEFIAAYEYGAKIFEEYYLSEIARLEKMFRDQSFDPIQKELYRLSKNITLVREDCGKKLSFASLMANTVLDSVENLLVSLQEAGVHLVESQDTLLFEPPFIRGDNADIAKGAPLMEVHGPDDFLKDPHVPQTLADPKDVSAAFSLRQFLDSKFSFMKVDVKELSSEAIRAAEEARSQLNLSSKTSSSNASSTKSSGKTRSDLRPSLLTADPTNVVINSVNNTSMDSLHVGPLEENAAKAPEGPFNKQQPTLVTFEPTTEEKALAGNIRDSIGVLEKAMVSLIDRINSRHGKFVRKIEALQRVLDEGATHRKAAENLLKSQQMQREEAVHASEVARTLDKELRCRMDKVEADMRETMQNALRDSAIVSHEAYAYRDYSTLMEKKLLIKDHVYDRVSRGMLDQAEILRDLQLGIQTMWTKSHPSGREEKNTQVHRILPSAYQAILEQCTRDTLLRIVNHLTVNSEESSRILMGVLDEHQKFLDSHTAEAHAAKTEEATLNAAASLLERLYEEGRIHCNPNHLPKTLPELLTMIVEKYDALMSFTEDYVKALIRRDEHHRSVEGMPFFNEEAPLPDVLRAIQAEATKVKCPFSRMLYPKPKPMKLQAPSGPSPKVGAAGETAPVSDMRSLPQLRTTAAAAARALTKAHPSAADLTQTEVSIVGNGRWTGNAAVKGDKKGVTPASSLFHSTPQAHPKIPHAPSAITRSMEAEAASKRVVPPGPPSRKALHEYLSSSYNHSPKELEDPTVPIPNPAKAMRKYNNPDTYFLERQKEIHNELERDDVPIIRS